MKLDWTNIKICVLQPDYSTSNVDYKNYDPVRSLSYLIPEAHFEYVLLNKLKTYSQLRELKYKGFDIFINLCEGYLNWNIPSIDVIFNLELLNLPYTGSTLNLYDPTKYLMKYIAYCQNVLTPNYQTLIYPNELKEKDFKLQYPVFVKPANAGDSLGIDENSLVHNFSSLTTKYKELIHQYKEVLIEEYIKGREFTVLVINDPSNATCIALEPIEYIFPEGVEFKTYKLKTSELHPESNRPCLDTELSERLKAASCNIFKGFNGQGYARIDFRVDKLNHIYFLEINFACSVFYTDGYEGSADYILKFDPLGKTGFLKKIIEEGLCRFQAKQKPYEVRKISAKEGYGIFAIVNIAKNELVFKGEEKAQRLVSIDYVNDNWSEEEKLNFRRYAYPVSDKHYILWDLNPSEWAPQNHSCDPNTYFKGLNIYASRNIFAGEELTLDYKQFLNENMHPFDCECRSDKCVGKIKI